MTDINIDELNKQAYLELEYKPILNATREQALRYLLSKGM